MEFCTPGVGAMDRLAAVSESRLGKTLRHSCDCGPLSPCVSVAVEGDPLDPKTLTPLLEFRRPVALSNLGEVWKEGAT